MGKALCKARISPASGDVTQGVNEILHPYWWVEQTCCSMIGPLSSQLAERGSMIGSLYALGQNISGGRAITPPGTYPDSREFPLAGAFSFREFPLAGAFDLTLDGISN